MINKIKNRSFSIYLDAIKNIDVLVELENGYSSLLIVATRKNVEYLMDKDKKKYFHLSITFIIEEDLTKKIIEEIVKAYV